MKTCTKCHTYKLLIEFNVRHAMRDGRTSRCKECLREAIVVYRIKNSERIKEQRLTYRDTEHGKAAYKRSWATQISRYPDKKKARCAVNHAIRDGILVRGVCGVCTTDVDVQGHHHLGYERENWLNVQWLCRPCHRAEDAKCV